MALDGRARAEAEEIRKLREQVTELEDVVKRERHRADLLLQQLEHVLQLQSPSCCNTSASAAVAEKESASEVAETASETVESEHVQKHNNMVGGGLETPHDEAAEDCPTTPHVLTQPSDTHVTIPKHDYDLLILKEKAISVLQEGITIADCSLPDMPLIFVNAGFSKITGYSVKNTIGKNCR
jgi:hypothetical protein